jgi:hypothetical protein
MIKIQITIRHCIHYSKARTGLKKNKQDYEDQPKIVSHPLKFIETQDILKPVEKQKDGNIFLFLFFKLIL